MSESQVNWDNVVNVKNLDKIKMKDIIGNEPIFEVVSDDEELVYYSEMEIFPPKDPRCSKSGTKPDADQQLQYYYKNE